MSSLPYLQIKREIKRGGHIWGKKMVRKVGERMGSRGRCEKTVLTGKRLRYDEQGKIAKGVELGEEA